MHFITEALSSKGHIKIDLNLLSHGEQLSKGSNGKLNGSVTEPLVTETQVTESRRYNPRIHTGFHFLISVVIQSLGILSLGIQSHGIQ
jgi:hypothetical protein